jgi:hypothetical protein
MNSSSFRISPMLTERIIQALSMLFAMYAVYCLYASFASIWYIVFEAPEFDFYETISVVSSCVIVPIAAFFFWKRKKIGWILIIFQSVMGLAFLAVILLAHAYIEADSFVQTSWSLSVHPAFMVAGAVFLLVICLKPIRAHYFISFHAMLLTISSAVIVAILVSIPLMNDLRVFEIYKMREGL